MSTIISRHVPTSFQLLSQDLQSLIFEFLPLQDCFSLQLVCTDFNGTIHRYHKLWARHLFSQFLSPSRDVDDILEEDIYDGIPLLSQDDFVFEQMSGAKALVQAHYTIKSHLGACLEEQLSAESSQHLTKALVDSFRNPGYPCPYLKRDIHFFSTNTLYQNFLTEVFFGIQGRSPAFDKNQSLAKTVVEKLRESHHNDFVTERDLLLLHRYSSDQSRSASTDSNEEREETEGESEAEHDDQSAKVLENRRSERPNFVEQFYSIIYELVQNRCDMVRACLTATKTPQGLLSEYCRQWFGFALTVMEVNKYLAPFSQYLNELYKEKCSQSSQNVPEFSIWRFMIKIWKNDLYEPLADRLHEAFLSTLGLVQEDAVNGKGIFERQEKKTNQFFDCSDPSEGIEIKDAKSKLLKSYYNAVCDLSYDEVTIFCWNCSAIDSETPKGVLDEKIIQEALRVYKTGGIKKPMELMQLLKMNYEMSEVLFGRELSLKMRECQLEFIRGFLVEHLVSTCDTLINTSEDYANDQGCNAQDINSFEHIFKALEAEELIQSKIGSNEKLRGLLFKALEKEQRSLFSPLLTFVDKTNEELACFYEENQEVYSDLVQRGLTQSDADADSLFIIIDDRSEEEQATKSW